MFLQSTIQLEMIVVSLINMIKHEALRNTYYKLLIYSIISYCVLAKEPRETLRTDFSETWKLNLS